MVTSYLVYRPANDAFTDVETRTTIGLFGPKTEVDFVQSQEQSPHENRLISVTSTSKKHTALKVMLNRKKIDYEITEVDYNPALFELIEEYH